MVGGPLQFCFFRTAGRSGACHAVILAVAAEAGPIRADKRIHRVRQLDCDGIGGGGRAGIHGFAGADLQSEHGAVRYGNGGGSLILRLVCLDMHLELLVGRGGRHDNALRAGRKRQGIFQSFGRESRGEGTLAERESLQTGVVAAPVAAQIPTVIAGVQDSDLVAGFQSSGGDGVVVKAVVGEPVVQGAHPARHGAAVISGKTVHTADVAAVQALSSMICFLQCCADAAHHGGAFVDLYPCVHKGTGPGSAVFHGIGVVLHSHMHLRLRLVPFGGKGREGDKAQDHGKDQKKAYDSFLHCHTSKQRIC